MLSVSPIKGRRLFVVSLRIAFVTTQAVVAQRDVRFGCGRQVLSGEAG
jgi:hypothetical protein